MPDFLALYTETAAALSGEPLAQAFLAMCATYVLEDPATVGAGLLVADGRMAFATAFLGLSIGIASGDVGLYLLGRFAKGWLPARFTPSPQALAAAKSRFERNALLAMLASRLVPGMRLPTYLAAGALRVNLWLFMAIDAVLSVAWTYLLLRLTVTLGAPALDAAGRYKWLLGGALVLLLFAAQRLLAPKREAPAEPPPFSSFELWPGWLFYLPVVGYWAWLALRFRSTTLPSAANPSIYGAGLIMESKSEILRLIPADEAHLVPGWIVFTKTRTTDLAEVKTLLAQANLTYPLVAKPDVGQRGTGVRPVSSDAALATYLAEFPLGHKLILQARSPYEEEVGLFYARHPESAHGEIISVTRKRFPTVTGDGTRTLKELILADLRARRISRVYLERFAGRTEEILPPGETLPLVFSGSHCKGAVFQNGAPLLTPALTKRIDTLARAIPGFYIGRFDLRFADEDALMRGERFHLIELNGAGAEATHIWDARTTLREAYGVLFLQYRLLFEIGAANRSQGHAPLPPRTILGDIIKYRRLAPSYPRTR